MPDDPDWLRNWFIFGEHQGGTVDVNDGNTDIFIGVPRAFAEQAIRYRCQSVESMKALTDFTKQIERQPALLGHRGIYPNGLTQELLDDDCLPASCVIKRLTKD